jgi:hypothetical protein
VKDYYRILGLKRGVSRLEIRKRFLELAQRYHPDHNPGDPESEDRFKDVHEAYRVLYDERKRSLYDLTGTSGQFSMPTPRDVQDYFYCRVAPAVVNLNDEVHVSFTYTSAGRIFKRPAFQGFHITGPPYVSNRMVSHEGVLVRETTLTYIVCPLKQGRLLIGPASIRIGVKQYQSDPHSIMVMAQHCYFMAKQQAGPDPFSFPLHYEEPLVGDNRRRSWRSLHHIVLIPRSRVAAVFHGLGTAIKVVCTLAGIVYFQDTAGTLLSAAAGNLFGWINCRILYRIAGVQPKFGYAETYPVVYEYLERGYKQGTDQGMPVISSHWIYKAGRALI